MADYTFIGPDADRLIKSGLRAYGSQPIPAAPHDVLGDSGGIVGGAVLPTTPKGYPNYGLTASPQPAVAGVVDVPTPGIDAAGMPWLRTAQPRGVLNSDLRPAAQPTTMAPQPASTPAGSTIPIPTGKYGWKGTSESINGQPTLVLGTPGTDGGGVGSFRPGSARVAGSPTTSARFSGSFDQPTGRMIEARSPVYDFGNSSTQTQTPIDFARMSRAERRFALANAKLDQGQQKLDTDAVQTQGVYDLGLRKLAVDQSQIDATAAANAGVPQLRAAQAAEAEAKATAGLRLTAAADAFKSAKPGTPEYGTALRDYLVLSGQGGALAKDPKQNIEKIAEKDAFGNTVRETLVQVNPDKTYTPLRSTAPEVATDAAFDAMIAADPKLIAKFKTLPPDQQAAQRKLFRDSQMQGK